MNDSLNDIHANCEEELAAMRSRFLERIQNTNNMVEEAIAGLIKGALPPGAMMSVLRDIQSDMIALGAKPTTREKGMTKKAAFSRRGNDMFWSIYDTNPKTLIGETIRWSGYDDEFWWTRLAPSDQFQVQIGHQTGRTYRLDPQTGEVEITEGEGR